jgi:hypothetical protein
MNPTVASTMSEMFASSVRTMQILLDATDEALPVHTTHVCGHDKNTWTLLTNLIDHETKHMQQVLQSRYEAKDSRSPMERVLAEWLETRARFLGTLVGLTVEEFNSETEPGEWTFAQVADHLLKLEHHALATMVQDGAIKTPISSSAAAG